MLLSFKEDFEKFVSTFIGKPACSRFRKGLRLVHKYYNDSFLENVCKIVIIDWLTYNLMLCKIMY